MNVNEATETLAVVNRKKYIYIYIYKNINKKSYNIRATLRQYMVTIEKQQLPQMQRVL